MGHKYFCRRANVVCARDNLTDRSGILMGSLGGLHGAGNLGVCMQEWEPVLEREAQV